jgi:ATP-binding cassette subfamily E protein 1
MFDEPSSYLDVKQRLNMAKAIRSMISMENYVILVEHDLAILDYLSDFICCLYGQATAFGVVTAPFGVREGINIYLDGFVPTENMRFRDESLVFRISESAEEELVAERTAHYQYPAFSKTFEGFAINVEAGNFSNAEIICMLGENATGKSTMIKILAGKESPDAGCEDLPSLGMSYKPQVISARFKGTVRQLLHTKIRDIYMSPSFTTDVTRPLNLDDIIDLNVQ